jgi:uncharacterized radical SAM superfamily Fe-S cluster-containing enzyme
MNESQIGEYQELININLNKIKKQVNQIEPRGGNRERFQTINSILECIRRTIDDMWLDEYREELNKEVKKNK